MGVPFAMLMEGLAAQGFTGYRCGRPRSRVSRVTPYELWLSKAGAEADECLVVASAYEFSDSAGNPQNLILVSCNTADVPKGLSNVLLAPAGLTVAEAVSFASDALVSVLDWRERMLSAAARNAEIGEFLGIAVERMSNPVAAFAADGTLLGWAGKFTGSKEGTIWEHLETGALDYGYYSPQDRGAFRRIVESSARPTSYHPTVDPAHEYVSAIIRVGGRAVASLGMVDVNEAIGEGQLQAIEMIAELMGSYLTDNEKYLRLAEGSTSLLHALLAGDSIPSGTLRRWSSGVAAGHAKGFVMVALRTENATSNSQGDSHAPVPLPYLRQLRDALPEAVVTYVDKGKGEPTAALLVPVEPGQGGLEQTVDRLGRILGSLGGSWGVSPHFFYPLQASVRFNQASFAAWFAHDRGKPYCLFEECAIPWLRDALQRGGAEATEHFCSPAVVRLWTSGDERDRESVRQLYVYLRSGRNFSAAARELYVHRNSLIYRMDKLSGTLECDLEQIDQNVVTYLLLSCALLVEGADGV